MSLRFVTPPALLLTAWLALIGATSCTETVELGNDATGCVPGSTQCSDCVDNDNDGRIDGFDPECTGGRDDDEGSFATGIPGDNQSRVDQDCAFDGDSGSGNDGCDLHVCCILDLMGEPCPSDLQPQRFDPVDCGVSDQCRENCEPLAPPGCDCFGCCTVCVGSGCADIFINPVHSPNCSAERFSDETVCTRCTKNPNCGADCGESDCILCPGQSADDLPATCDVACPNGSSLCTTNGTCQSGEFCANGCCIEVPD